MKTILPKLYGLMVLLAFFFPGSAPARAHCDSLDGPVVKAAQRALETGNVNIVLIWVQKADEPEIREAFERTLAVRRLGSEARELADLYFFETLVRIHRAGEGAPYTGLKPAGRDLGPAIPAADKGLESGSTEDVEELLTQALWEGVQERFRTARSRRLYRPNDVAAGREYVEAYVAFLHYVEAAYQALAGKQAESHTPEAHRD